MHVKSGKRQLTKKILSVLPSSMMQKSCCLEKYFSKEHGEQYQVGSQSGVVLCNAHTNSQTACSALLMTAQL